MVLGAAGDCAMPKICLGTIPVEDWFQVKPASVLFQTPSFSVPIYKVPELLGSAISSKIDRSKFGTSPQGAPPEAVIHGPKSDPAYNTDVLLLLTAASVPTKTFWNPIIA